MPCPLWFAADWNLVEGCTNIDMITDVECSLPNVKIYKLCISVFYILQDIVEIEFIMQFVLWNQTGGMCMYYRTQ